MKALQKGFLKAFAVELVLYSGLVLAYFFLVLHLLGDWIFGLYTQHRQLYAVVALVLILGQGIVLDSVTSVLLRLIKRR